MDKAGRAYWDETWRTAGIPDPVDPSDLSIANHVNRERHLFFSQVVEEYGLKGKRLLEVGAGRSTWLPYFARKFGMEVAGIDYSEPGCRQAEEILARAHVNAHVICADFFHPPREMEGAYDIVVSFGVAEHFLPTEKAISAFASFLRKGGLMVTFVPNLSGAIGSLQKSLNRPVYDLHVPLDKESLSRAHTAAGLKVQRTSYHLSTNFGVCNLNGLAPNTVSWKMKRLLFAALGRCSRTVWYLEKRFGTVPTSSLFSPYIYCIAQKTAKES